MAESQNGGHNLLEGDVHKTLKVTCGHEFRKDNDFAG